MTPVIGWASAKMEKKKKTLYLEDCIKNGYLFSPLVLETMGGIGVSSMAIVRKIILRMSNKLNVPLWWSKMRVMGVLSVAVQRGNAEMIRDRRPPLPFFDFIPDRPLHQE